MLRILSVSRYGSNRNVMLKYLWFLLMTELQILLILLWLVTYAQN